MGGDEGRTLRISRRAFLGGLATAGVGALLSACGGSPASPAANATAPAAGVGTAAATQAPSSPLANVPRERTLIWGFEGGPVTPPDNSNPYQPTQRNSYGMHQVMIESLYYLNYENGKSIPWLAESHAFNDKNDEVTVKLRKGVTWSDGKPFTSKDVVFTINMLKDAAPKLTYSNEMKKWVKEVKATDDNTAVFSLAETYPRFILDYFSVHIWGAVRFVPEHIWKGQDPTTFTFNDLGKG